MVICEMNYVFANAADQGTVRKDLLDNQDANYVWRFGYRGLSNDNVIK